MNFSQGYSGTKVQCESCLFPEERHQNSQEWVKFMNFLFWPFLWFGLPGRLLNKGGNQNQGRSQLFPFFFFWFVFLFCGAFAFLVGGGGLLVVPEFPLGMCMFLLLGVLVSFDNLEGTTYPQKNLSAKNNQTNNHNKTMI